MLDGDKPRTWMCKFFETWLSKAANRRGGKSCISTYSAKKFPGDAIKEMCDAAKNRRELIAAGLTSRRDLFKMGLLTAGGMLVAKSGLSARAWATVQTNQSAEFRRQYQPRHESKLRARQPDGQPADAGLSSSRCRSCRWHGRFQRSRPRRPKTRTRRRVKFAPLPSRRRRSIPAGSRWFLARLYKINQRQFTAQLSIRTCRRRPSGVSMTAPGTRSPGPTYQAFYGKPQLTRNINSLPT